MNPKSRLNITHKMPTLQEVKEYATLGISIDKQEVVNWDFIRIDAFIAILRESKTNARSKIIISFDYDVPEELYEIDEVRLYVKEIVKRYKEVFYYIDLGGHNDLLMLFLCLFDIKKVTKPGSNERAITFSPSKEVLLNAIDNMREYIEKINDQDLIAQRKIIDAILLIIRQPLS